MRYAIPVYLLCFVVASLVLGGATQQGAWSDAILQILSLPLIGLCLFRGAEFKRYWAAVIFLLLVCLLPIAQLVPLPPELWASLPGRELVVKTYAGANIPLPWLPVSMQPATTWRSAFSLLPAAAVFLSMLCVEKQTQRVVTVAVLVTAFIGIIIGVGQIMGGPDSPLRFYAVTNVDRAVGFFANANHNAALLYAMIPLTAAWAIAAVRDPRLNRLLILGLSSLFAVAVVVALAVTRSRAGLILGALAGVGCVPLALAFVSGAARRRVLLVSIAANAAVLLLFFQFAFVGISERVKDADLVEDLRWPLASVTVQMAKANLPFGTGFGTFVPTYQHNEPRELLREQYINRAHNDWLEVGLEGGALSAFLLAVFLTWYVVVGARVWRGDTRDVTTGALARAGWLIVGLLLIHSLLDYPLRTTALMTLFAISCALVATSKVPAPEFQKTGPRRSSASV